MWSVSLKWRHSKNQITIKKEKERKSEMIMGARMRKESRFD